MSRLIRCRERPSSSPRLSERAVISLSDRSYDLREYADGSGSQDVDRTALEAQRARLRAELDRSRYEAPEYAWLAERDVGYFGFLYDRRVYDPQRRLFPVDELVDRVRATYGALDSILLWTTYPRLGIDSRSQIDHLLGVPGGRPALRRLIDQFHSRDVRVLIPYLPVDVTRAADSSLPKESSRAATLRAYAAYAELVAELEVDGVFLDTAGAGDPAFRDALDRARSGVAMLTEYVPTEAQSAASCTAGTLPFEHRPNNLPLTWWGAVWQRPEDVPLDVVTMRWLEPRYSLTGNLGHYPIHDNQCPYVAADFFHGMGHQVIENLFGRTVTFSPEATRILRRSALLRRTYRAAFLDPGWQPYVPTLHPSLLAHRWHGSGYRVYTLFNASASAVGGDLLSIELDGGKPEIHDAWTGRAARARYVETGERRFMVISGTIDSQRCGCIVVAGAPAHNASGAGGNRVPSTVEAPLPQLPGVDTTDDPYLPIQQEPRFQTAQPPPLSRSYRRTDLPPESLFIPGGRYLFRIEGTHTVPEGGCYDYPDRGEHAARMVNVGALAVARTEVMNAAFADFLVATRYEPADPGSFLRHWERAGYDLTTDRAAAADRGAGAKPWEWRIPDGAESHPVVWVSLDDARAYAKWAGMRLPTEEEWQWFAGGPDQLRWPWGDEFDPDRCNGIDGTQGTNRDIIGAEGGPTAVDTYAAGATPTGILDLCGNVWELTESYRQTGYVRYVILKGGCHYRAGGSLWFQPGGAQPVPRHAKMLLLTPQTDRAATIGFRCVAELSV